MRTFWVKLIDKVKELQNITKYHEYFIGRIALHIIYS